MSATLSLSPPTGQIWSQAPSSPHKGGILLKPESSLPSSPNNQTVHLPSTSDLADSSARPVLSHAGSSASDGSNPPAPLEIRIEAVPHPDREGRPTHRPAPTTKGKPSSIKFAPLPDPRAHTRSLSTGSNVRLAAKLGPGGERTEELQTSGGSESSFRRRRESEDSGLLDGIGDVDDGAAHGLDDMSDDDDDDQAPSKRRSSILGSSWSKGTMKLFGVKSSSSSKNLGRTSSIESNSSGLSGPTSDLQKTFSNLTRTLSPSVSRSSNHSTESAADRQARLLASLSPDKARAASRESTTRARRQSATSGTLDVPPSSSSFNSLSSSPVNSPRSLVGARMLNGRAYGVKGGVEAIRKAEEEARRGPEFSEWGSVGSMGSNSVNREEEDDGSGMSWARKRREAREKAAAERAAAEEAATAGSDALSPSSSSDDRPPISPITPTTSSGDLPASFNSVALSESEFDPPVGFKDDMDVERKRRALSHDVHAYTVPGRPHGRVPDGEGLKTPTAATSSNHATVGAISIGAGGGGGQGRGIVVESEDEDELDMSDSDDDDGRPREDEDEDDDDEEKAAMEEARRTALCAGVEVVSRHKSIPN